jgi:hypothetical protein
MLWIRPLMPGLSEKLLLLLALLAVGAGCKPQVGDDCKISTDCSAAGDRLCDITAPGGYCTVFNCEPNSCPDGESLCVQFGAVRSPACEAEPSPTPSPYARTFCMATCDDDSDCRSGYTCQDLSPRDNDWGAVLIDTNRGNKACVVPLSGKAVPRDKPNDVCDASTGDGAGDGDGGQGGAGG